MSRSITLGEREYAVILEKAGKNWGAYSPDVDGCIATGDTADEALSQFQEALDLHIRTIKEVGGVVPEPSAIIRTVKIAA
jgi:predicted RNase H-like HicB family nuclease